MPGGVRHIFHVPEGGVRHIFHEPEGGSDIFFMYLRGGSTLFSKLYKGQGLSKHKPSYNQKSIPALLECYPKMKIFFALRSKSPFLNIYNSNLLIKQLFCPPLPAQTRKCQSKETMGSRELLTIFFISKTRILSCYYHNT